MWVSAGVGAWLGACVRVCPRVRAHGPLRVGEMLGGVTASGAGLGITETVFVHVGRVIRGVWTWGSACVECVGARHGAYVRAGIKPAPDSWVACLG